MRAPLIFWYANDQEADHVAATPDEIDAALDHVASLADKVRVIAEITRQDVDADGLYAGFNGEVGTLHYVGGGSPRGSYSQSASTKGASETDTVPLVYDYQWNAMEFPPDSEIPIADVRAAVHEYHRTGARPTCVRWQEWSPPRNPDVTIPADDDPACG